MFFETTSVTTVQAAALTGKAAKTIRARIADGSMRATGRVIQRIEIADLERFIGRKLTRQDWLRAREKLVPTVSEVLLPSCAV